MRISKVTGLHSRSPRWPSTLRGHDKSSPYRSETNGIAENVVRRVTERTSAFLVQWVLPKSVGDKRWNVSVICET